MNCKSIVCRIGIVMLLVLCLAPVSALTATVVSTTGKTEIQQGSQWLPLKQGDNIAQGKVIATGFKSQVVLKVGESVITVRPLTRLTLEQLMEKEGDHTSKMYLSLGSIDANIKAVENKKVNFSVSNPVATASVRGTSGRVMSTGRVIGRTGTWQVARKKVPDSISSMLITEVPPEEEEQSAENTVTETDIAETAGIETTSTETEGTETDGTETASTETEGTETNGTETASTETEGTETDGTETASTETEGTETNGTETASTAPVTVETTPVAATQQETRADTAFVRPGESVSITNNLLTTPQVSAAQIHSAPSVSTAASQDAAMTVIQAATPNTSPSQAVTSKGPGSVIITVTIQ